MPNRLSRETSPYLQQHADNPVDWYPWGEEALALARVQDKPILLSIGYSACHWCHVMAHESFEDAEVAALMNTHFINIKVDREERPDIDQIYQTAHSMMSQRSGGWPLTMFLTPQQEPFFSGTYFPKTPRYELPGFGDLAVRVAQFYHERKDDLAEQNRALAQAFALNVPPASSVLTVNKQTLQLAFEHLKSNFDFEHGGFGSAPKFPNPADITLLLRQASAGNSEHLRRDNSESLRRDNSELLRRDNSELLRGDNSAEAEVMALQMLRSMAAGGIYDQIGGGFCRYSVDERWMIPHFEKMLYDNGQLLCLYAEGWQLSYAREPELAARFEQVIKESVQWLLREMRSSGNAYYSSLDADSLDEAGHNEEGAFYVWQPAQVKALLTPAEFTVASRCYGFDRAANFEGRAWHPYLAAAPAPGEESLLVNARAKLYAARGVRSRPGRDQKILTSWNALAIKGLARAGRVMKKPEWVKYAQHAVDFIHAKLWKDGRLLATCKDDTAHLNAYLDDYAFLLDALLDLMQAEYRSQDMEFAEDLAEALLEEFEAENGGFYFTGHHHEVLIHRTKQPYDNATPSGNGIAAIALQRLGHVLGEPRYLQAAERTLMAFDSSMQRNPAACASLLVALAEHLEPPSILILRGGEAGMAQWRDVIDAQYLPHLLCFALPATLNKLPPMLARPVAGDVNAWLCRGVECLPVISNLDALMAHISPFQS